MNRRIRTGPLTVNDYGHYVYYRSIWESAELVSVALIISGGTLAGVWKFPLGRDG